ncbi:Uncharacterised protein [Morganella morganii]|nr:Uncharacterised protein [Morganella morganii]
MLPDVGAVAVGGSDVVIDDTIYTSGPATGSFDASLLVLKALRGEELAALVELAIEYDPRPPFRTGSPATCRAGNDRHITKYDRAAEPAISRSGETGLCPLSADDSGLTNRVIGCQIRDFVFYPVSDKRQCSRMIGFPSGIQKLPLAQYRPVAAELIIIGGCL